MLYTYLFEIITKDSEFEGNSFAVMAEDLNTAWEVATDYYYDEQILYCGKLKYIVTDCEIFFSENAWQNQNNMLYYRKWSNQWEENV